MAKKLTLGLATLLAGALGCTGTPFANKTDAYQAAVDRAFAQLEENTGRSLASTSDMKAQLGVDFQKLRGKFEMIVFPKITNITEKSNERPFQTFASPRKFEFVAQRLLNCQQLLKEKTDKWNHQKDFPATIDGGLDCGIFRVSQSAPKLTAANYSRDDVTEMRLYLDSDYRAYGVDIDVFVDRNRVATTNLKWDERSPLSSGLALFPVDLPSLPNLGAAAKQNAATSLPSDPFVKSKLAKFGVKVCASGSVFEYRDVYGSRQRVQWCQGNSWPTTIENDHYFAVLKE